MAKIKQTQYKYRFLARFVIESKTPLAVGSGEKDIITDALVATDVNGLPYIPGTAIAGVVRNMMNQQGIDTNNFFGFQGNKDGQGSEIIFTEAKILDSQGEVVDGLNIEAINSDLLLENYKELPIRQHVRINHKGVTDKSGKFDNQVVFAGTRFCFEIEVVAKEDDKTNFVKVIEQLQSKVFRIGGGSRKGYGEIEIIEIKTSAIDLGNKDDLNLYLEKSSNLSNSKNWQGWKCFDKSENDDQNWQEIVLTISPDDFFMFGSGMSSDDGNADMTPVRARKVNWSEAGKAKLSNQYILIPASSVKGAMAHRVAFHYNKLVEATIENEKGTVGDKNLAVQKLFGYMENDKPIQRGNVLISDVFEQEPDWQKFAKLINHVAIDRFTGGAIDGALFTEQTLYQKGKEFKIRIFVNKKAFEDENVKEAFFNTLNDICNGMLPLGGGVNRGNGIFSGSYELKKELV